MQQEEREYIGGKHAVLEAFQSTRAIHKVWISNTSQSHWAQPIYDAAKQAGVIVQTVDKRKLDQMAPGLQHQGVVAQVAAATYADLDEMIEGALASGRQPLFVVLDELEDPHNLGSIIRTAECAGAHRGHHPEASLRRVDDDRGEDVRWRGGICARGTRDEFSASARDVEAARHLGRRRCG